MKLVLLIIKIFASIRFYGCPEITVSTSQFTCTNIPPDVNLRVTNAYQLSQQTTFDFDSYVVFHRHLMDIEVLQGARNRPALKPVRLKHLNNICKLIFHDVELHVFDNAEGIAIRALKEKKVGDLLSKIYFDDCMTIVKASASDTSHWRLHGLLALKVMQQAGKMANTKWKYYFDHIFWLSESHPMQFDEEQMRILNGSMTFMMLVEQQVVMFENYVILSKALLRADEMNLNTEFYLGPGEFTLKNFRGAWATVLSRADQDIFSLRLVPCWDFLNHRKPVNSRTTMSYGVHFNEGHIETFAKILIPQYGQVVGSYHNEERPMQKIFLKHGFVDRNAPFQLNVKFNPQTESQFGTKVRLLQEYLGMRKIGKYLKMYLFNNDILYSNYTYAMAVILQTGQKPNDFKPMIALLNATEYITTQVKLQQSKYKYSLETIDSFVASHVISANTKLAFTQLKAEQGFLHDYLKRLNLKRALIVKYMKINKIPF